MPPQHLHSRHDERCVCVFRGLRLKPTVYSFDGIVVFVLLAVCTCAYMRRVPTLKAYFLSDKKGFFGTFYKGAQPLLDLTHTYPHAASVIGIRLHVLISALCLFMALYVMFVK